jgi:hypothetical protein
MTNIPKMIPVKSSNVEAVGHDAASNELHVRFKGGAHYIYANVPAAIHDSLHASESVGKFIGAHIKPHFTHRRLPS